MLETEKDLVNLANEAFLDEEITITLRLRDWWTLAVIWTANGGEPNYNTAVDHLRQGPKEYTLPSFDPCMYSPDCPHATDYATHKKIADCPQERMAVESVLFPFIGLQPPGRKGESN